MRNRRIPFESYSPVLSQVKSTVITVDPSSKSLRRPPRSWAEEGEVSCKLQESGENWHDGDGRNGTPLPHKSNWLERWMTVGVEHI